jgi:hypothetical protein
MHGLKGLICNIVQVKVVQKPRYDGDTGSIY